MHNRKTIKLTDILSLFLVIIFFTVAIPLLAIEILKDCFVKD